MEGPHLTVWITSFFVGILTGVLSGFGVGGGSLLLIYLTAFAGFAQQEAQGINLIYFLPAAIAALPSHFKNGFVAKETAIPAIITGLVFSAIGAWCSNRLDITILRKLFGVFLLIIGLSELFRKDPAPCINEKRKS
jgi:hypothetical protein